MSNELMTVKDLAQRLKVTEITIRRWLARGQLTGIDTPAGWRFEEKDIQAWIDQHRNHSVKEQPE